MQTEDFLCGDSGSFSIIPCSTMRVSSQLLHKLEEADNDFRTRNLLDRARVRITPGNGVGAGPDNDINQHDRAVNR
jgi:hypothetical protein